MVINAQTALRRHQIIDLHKAIQTKMIDTLEFFEIDPRSFIFEPWVPRRTRKRRRGSRRNRMTTPAAGTAPPE